MIKLFLTLLLAFSSAHSYALNAFHDNQVTQMAGEKNYIYLPPHKRIIVRQEPSLESDHIGLLTPENSGGFIYKPHDDKWLTVTTFGGELIGYSYKKLFEKRTVAVLEDTIVTADGVYRINFYGYPYDPDHTHGHSLTYDESQYYYQITMDNNELFSKGDKITFNHILERVISGEGEDVPIQLYSLNIQDEKIGWFFGWNNIGEGSEIDFSFARVLIPQSSMQHPNGLYTETYRGINFNKIADFLDKKPNQLFIIHTKSQGNVFYCTACLGFYYIPRQLTLTKDGEQLSVGESNIKITKDLISSDPAYAYAIAFNLDDYDSMRKASSTFKKEIKLAGELCGRHDVDIELTVKPNNRYIDMSTHWHSIGLLHGYINPGLYMANSAANCLENVLPFNFVWHFFYRTGLFPSEKTINKYINNKYRYAEFIEQ